MAKDWIKMRHDLAGDPAVLKLVESLASVSVHTVVGMLHQFWSWASENTMKGDLRGVTSTQVDRLIGCPGFAEALAQVGWLRIKPTGVSVPHFERHMSESAKARAGEAMRKVKQRRKLRSTACPDAGPDVRPDKSVTRAESRAEGRAAESREPKIKEFSSIAAEQSELDSDAAAEIIRYEVVCSLLQKLCIGNKRLFPKKTASLIAQRFEVTERQIVWAITRYERQASKVDNPAGYLRNLMELEVPSHEWDFEYSGAKLEKLIRSIRAREVHERIELQAGKPASEVRTTGDHSREERARWRMPAEGGRGG